jgi:hypothetical protein
MSVFNYHYFKCKIYGFITARPDFYAMKNRTPNAVFDWVGVSPPHSPMNFYCIIYIGEISSERSFKMRG